MLSGLPSAFNVIISGSFSIPVTASSLFLSKIGLSETLIDQLLELNYYEILT